MKKTYFLFILIVFCQFSNGQNKLTGHIFDENNNSLTGAIVYLPELYKGVVSNENGYFEIKDLPNSKIKVQISYLGYATKIETIFLSKTSDTLNVKLQESVTETEEVIVTGGYNSTQHENAVKIEVLKINPIEKLATPNFMETLTKIPGVDMISKGNGVSKPVIRGLAMNDILSLNNGVRLENYQYSDHHPLGIDEFGVDDVEVIKGPASLLYGSDAIGGVINFIKEKPANENSIQGDYNLQLFSNSLGVSNNLGIKRASKNVFGGIRFGNKTNADYLQGGGDYAPNTRFNDRSLKANVGFTNKNASLNLFYDYNNEKLGLAEDEAIEQIFERGRKNDIFYQEFNSNMLSSQNKFYFGKYKLDVNGALQNTELTHFGEKNVYEIQMMLKTFTYETKLYFPSSKNSEYIVGLQGMNQQNLNVHNRETILLPNAETDNYSAFGMLQYTFFEKIKLQTGLRYDYKNIHTQQVYEETNPLFRPAIEKPYGSFSGSLGATYNVNENLLFRLNAASAFRTPNLAELTSNGQHETRYEIGNKNLVPEKSFETDMSLHYHKNNFQFDLAGFYNHINHFIFIAPTGTKTADEIPIYAYRQKNSALFGGEAGLHYHPQTIKWLHFETRFSSVIGKQENGENLPFIPANKWNVELRIEKEKWIFLQKPFFAVNSHTAFAQNLVAPDETPTKGYTLFGINLGSDFKLKKQLFQWSLGCSNLFDVKYINHLSTLKEVNLLDAGRNIAFTLKIPFEIHISEK